MNWKRAALAVLAIVPIVLLLAFGLTRDPNRIESPLPGHPAPDFTVEVMPPSPAGDNGWLEDGTTMRLADLRGHVVVLNFWASWCIPCRYEHPALTKVARVYQDRGVRFVGILYNDSPEAARRWLADLGGESYPTGLDPDSRTAIAYGLYGVPETFFIGRDGRVGYKHIGPVTESLLVEKIEELLNSPETPT